MTSAAASVLIYCVLLLTMTPGKMLGMLRRSPGVYWLLSDVDLGSWDKNLKLSPDQQFNKELPKQQFG